MASCVVVHAQSSSFRPPAVPLLTIDPYLSVWSESDKLTDDVTRHWTHAPHPLIGLIRVDGTTFRVMGAEPKGLPALPQTALKVTATKTDYWFENSRIRLNLSFLTPAIPSDLNLYARPVTYVKWLVKSADGAPHRVQIYEGTSSLLAVNSPDQAVVWKKSQSGALTLLKAGTKAQTLLRPAGDDTRIDWGYLYVAAPKPSQAVIASEAALASAFVRGGTLLPGAGADKRMPRQAKDATATLGVAYDLGSVGHTPVARHLMVGYDEIYSIDYFGWQLAPYWRRNGATPASLFDAAERDFANVAKRAAAFDRELQQDAEKVGGSQYAQIVALAYRQCVAANGLAADASGKPLLFTKENTSNGDIATVDVIFPMDPIWVLLSPTLARASLESTFAYAASPHWKFPNAPHDLGTYPRVFGRDDGGEGMPVEESGNMILLADAIAHAEGTPAYASRWWSLLTKWAKYLEQYGLDPEDQLCTDDFMGHLAHNANLSVKAILALGAYGDLAAMRGDKLTAKRYQDLARADARHWVTVADAGDRSLLAFDQPNTWSQKYNLVWDGILGLRVFPPEVAQKELAYYRSVMQPYGVPLDSRTHLTKTDWTIWSASMAKSKPDFEFFMDPIYRYLNETSTRDPISDSYVTDDVKSGGMHARPVVGGFFTRFLTDRKIWRKWASKDPVHINTWAPLPKIPTPRPVQEIVPTARTKALTWRFTTTRPSPGWQRTGFDATSWEEGKAGFGTAGTPGAIIGTVWSTDDIWLRRTLTLPKADLRKLRLLVHHDEDVEVYLDGVPAMAEDGFLTGYSAYPISSGALKAIRSGGAIVVAVHCHQTTGGQYVDVGFGIEK